MNSKIEQLNAKNNKLKENITVLIKRMQLRNKEAQKAMDKILYIIRG